MKGIVIKCIAKRRKKITPTTMKNKNRKEFTVARNHEGSFADTYYILLFTLCTPYQRFFFRTMFLCMFFFVILLVLLLLLLWFKFPAFILSILNIPNKSFICLCIFVWICIQRYMKYTTHTYLQRLSQFVLAPIDFMLVAVFSSNTKQ